MWKRRSTRRSLLRSWSGPLIGLLITATVTGVVVTPRESAAQDFFGFFRLFGGQRERAPAPPPRYQPYAYADPSQVPDVPVRRPSTGGYEGGMRSTYCVRLCDGRFFPMSGPAASSQASAAKMCSAMCPAAKTAIYRGGQIDHAAASNGDRYADLANAFVYRDKLVDGCTCNGKNALGLARIDVAADPTLRAGDVVATAGGLTVFKGRKGDNHKSADFTPIEDAGKVAVDVRRRLATTRVQDTP